MYSSNIIWPGLIGLTVWSFLFKDKPIPMILKVIVTIALLSILGIMIVPVPWVEVILNVSLIPISIASVYIIFLVFPAIKSNIPGAKQLLIAGIIISILVVYANLDWVFIHSGFDLTGWIPFFLTLAFMSIFIDRFWAVTVDLLESNTELKNIRDGMEIEILTRTSEFRNANNMLEGKLKEINRLHSKVYHMALHDTLTGLYNRHFLAETLDREFARASREHHPIGLLMIDIDHFKVINDTFGHKAGDDVLRKFGEETLSHIRQEDVAFRYGGEEFLILLPRASLNDARVRADNLRVLIEDLNFQIEDKIGQITVSVGVAEYPSNGNTPDEVLNKADEALYAAKRAGRNRVEVANVQA
jgi:diguanylate cyclase (GGDEF)-like protein